MRKIENYYTKGNIYYYNTYYICIYIYLYKYRYRYRYRCILLVKDEFKTRVSQKAYANGSFHFKVKPI